MSPRTIPLFSHLLNAHQIWNSKIITEPSLGINDVHTLKECREIDEENHLQTLDIIDTFEMSSIISYKNSKGNFYKNSVRDILFHVGNHFTHHRGQLISDLRQHGIVPIETDFIAYKRILLI